MTLSDVYILEESSILSHHLFQTHYYTQTIHLIIALVKTRVVKIRNLSVSIDYCHGDCSVLANKS